MRYVSRYGLLLFWAPTRGLMPGRPRSYNQDNQGHNYAWSYLYYIDSPAMLWTVHIAAIIVFAMLTLGLFTRVTSVLAWLITIAYCNRLTGTLFGLDQINAFIATYLILGDSGGAWSLDRWLARDMHGSSSGTAAETSFQHAAPTIRTNIAIVELVHAARFILFWGVWRR